MLCDAAALRSARPVSGHHGVGVDVLLPRASLAVPLDAPPQEVEAFVDVGDQGLCRRQVFVHPTAVAAPRRYQRRRGRWCPTAAALPGTPAACCWPSLPARPCEQPCQLDIADLDAATVTAFLQHLETGRANAVTSRNARLAAVRSLFRYAAGSAPWPVEWGEVRRVPAVVKL